MFRLGNTRKFLLNNFATRRTAPSLLKRAITGPSSLFLQSVGFSTISKDSDFVQGSGDAAVQTKIKNLIESNRVVVFIKGTSDAPQCGFSKAVVQILAAEEVDDYVFADVLKSPALREGIKKFTDWPTIPQVFVDGEFIGGCDILIEMHKSGELKKLLKQKNITK